MLMDANTVDFEDVTVLGKPMIFTNLRIDRSTVPKGMYTYEVRHDDFMLGEPCQIAEHILVNHWGTVISNSPLNLDKIHDGIEPINPGEFENGMTVLVVEPYKTPYVKNIEGGLESLQKEVGGYIEAMYSLEDDDAALICNEEGKINGMPLNRAMRDEDGDIYDIVAGTFLVVGLTEDDFGSLNREQLAKYCDFFREPEDFIMLNGKIITLPVPSEVRAQLNGKYLDIDPEKDWNYEGTATTLKEYMEKNPPEKKKEKIPER